MRKCLFQKTTAWMLLLTLLVIQCPVTTYGAISFGNLSEFRDRLGISSGLNKLSSSLRGLSKLTNGLKSSLSGFTNSLSSLSKLSSFNKTIKSNVIKGTSYLTSLGAKLKLPSVNVKSSKSFTLAGVTNIKKENEMSQGLSTSGLKFNAIYDSKTNSIKVSWTSSVYDVVEIRRGVNNADDKEIGRFEGKNGSYTDKNVTSGNTYKYLLYVKYDGDYHGIADVTVKVPKQ